MTKILVASSMHGTLVMLVNHRLCRKVFSNGFKDWIHFPQNHSNLTKLKLFSVIKLNLEYQNDVNNKSAI